MAHGAFYFGCVRSAGHFLWCPGLSGSPWLVPELPEELQPDRMDGRFPPGGFHDGRKSGYSPTPQVEGAAALRHVGGWTVLAFWDRSVDTRGNSNSAFLLEGEHDFAEALRLARETFPEVWARFGFEVRLA